jgi:hypothetical protein
MTDDLLYIKPKGKIDRKELLRLKAEIEEFNNSPAMKLIKALLKK